MHPERAAEPADHDEQVDEVGLGREQLAELVDDDEQRRHRLQRRALLAGALVVAQRRVVAGRAQRLLAAHHLALDGVLHAVDEDQLVLEVGDDRRRVRQHVEARERRPALEVDEDEVQRLGRVRQRQAEHERAQQLGLARPGGADDQPVRAHAALRRLLDVELDRLAVGADPDRHAQPVARRAGAPRHGGVDRARIAEAQQVGQAEVDRQRVGRLGRRRRHPQVADRAGERLGLRDAQRVGDAQRHASRRRRRPPRRTSVSESAVDVEAGHPAARRPRRSSR